MTIVSNVDKAVAEISTLVTGIEAGLEGWAAELGRGLEALSGKPNGTAIDRLVRPTVEALLQEHSPEVAGAGFIANAGLMGPNRSYIAWWQGPELERVDALANFSPNSMSRYVKSEWFRIPVQTGRPHVTGPYVDFLCTDEYVLTFTHPVLIDGAGSIAGIVGIDITVQTLENQAEPILRTIGPNAALVNTEGRTIACTSPALGAGDLAVKDDDAGEFPVGNRFKIWSSALPL